MEEVLRNFMHIKSFFSLYESPKSCSIVEDDMMWMINFCIISLGEKFSIGDTKKKFFFYQIPDSLSPL